jgi:hypothetical protein
MSHEDADAEQDSCCRDDLAHSFPPCLTGESSTGSFPDDFAELGKWFRRPGRRRRPSAKQLHGIAGSVAAAFPETHNAAPAEYPGWAALVYLLGPEIPVYKGSARFDNKGVSLRQP